MSIKRLLNAIGTANLVSDVKRRKDGDKILAKLGVKVVEQHKSNMSSMNDWSTLLEAGVKVAMPDTAGQSFPWENASNYKSPEIIEAVRGFGDRAKMEILSKPDLVSTSITGEDTDDKKSKADNVSTHMNYQINTEMPYYREELSRALYKLAAQGALFKKTFFDSTEGRNHSEWVSYPSFSINQECDCLEQGYFTEEKQYLPNDVWERQKAKIWIDDEDIIPTLETEDEESEQFTFLEQYTQADLDKDGYEEPYIVTVHKSSSKVVRIVPLWDVESIFVQYNGASYNLESLQNSLKASADTLSEEFNDAKFQKDKQDVIDNATLLRIEPLKVLTYYGFIEPVDGSFLNWGYAQYMVSAVKGINKGANSLFNSADLANLQGGWLSSQHRDAKKGPASTKPGKWHQTKIDSQDLASSIFPYPFKEPSAGLMTLVENLKAEVGEMAHKFNVGDAMQPNIPASSVLGMLQEGIVPTSALMKNVTDSLSREFKILFSLNKKYTDPTIYKAVVEAQSANYEIDYDMEGMDIEPTANAQFSSQSERIQLAEAQLAQVPLVLQSGGNPIPIIKGYYEAINSPIINEIYPEGDNAMSPEEKQQLEQMRQLQEQQVQMQQQQTELLQAQVSIMNQEQQRKQIETDAKIQEAAIKLEQKDQELAQSGAKIIGDLEAKRAQLMIDLEKVEAEDERTRMESERRDIDIAIKVMGANNAERDRRLSRQDGQ